MSFDRYQSCSCGSGKKFKFCCYQNRENLDGIADSDLLRRAVEFPLYEVRVNSSWQEVGLAQVVIARQLPNLKYLFGGYVVDTYCLGLKDTFVRLHCKYEEWAKFLRYCPEKLEKVSYEDARSIVLGGIEYARQLGFDPHPDWKHASAALESERDFEHKFNFGKDGMPCYIEGPNDDSTQIMEKLKPLTEQGRANYRVGMNERII